MLCVCTRCLLVPVLTRWLLLLLQPLHLHGSHGRDTATGRGVLFAAREFLKASLYTNVRDCSFVIQVRT
jgi:hypothetical protein